MNNLERERELRFRISELLRYRSYGITTLEEAIHYEQHASFQRQQLRQNKAVSVVFIRLRFFQFCTLHISFECVV